MSTKDKLIIIIIIIIIIMVIIIIIILFSVYLLFHSRLVIGAERASEHFFSGSNLFLTTLMHAHGLNE